MINKGFTYVPTEKKGIDVCNVIKLTLTSRFPFVLWLLSRATKIFGERDVRTNFNYIEMSDFYSDCSLKYGRRRVYRF